ncbi:MAG: maleylpyruvate isomerase family protein [SAR202 cluster bacterium]|nr:maleylpyruvate isomerase family protein [SAR202 cluster bacterium]
MLCQSHLPLEFHSTSHLAGAVEIFMSRQAFKEASQFFVDTVARIPAGRWDSPALGVWTVRELVGHTNRALLTLEDYSAHPSSTLDIQSAAEYYIKASKHADHADIAERGREAGKALGPDPLNTVRGTQSRVLALVARLDPAQPIASRFGGIRADHFIETRVFELVIHTLDIAQSLNLKVNPPKSALALTLRIASDIAAATGKGVDLALALTGRRPLPKGFSVLQ